MNLCNRIIERVLHNSLVIDMNQYLPVKDEILMNQTSRSQKHDFENSNLCFAYVIKKEMSWYMDIYFYYKITITQEPVMKRFVLAPGYQMSDDDENLFVKFVKDKPIMIVNHSNREIVYLINKISPELHLINYIDSSILLLHIYYASFQSGTYELLFKAGGLAQLAWYFEYIDDWNVLATNVEDAFDVPINMLRKMTCEKSIKYFLNSKENRLKIARIYRKYHSILNDISQLSCTQLYYLDNCMEHDIPVDKKLLIALEHLDLIYSENSNPYNIWIEYQELKNKYDFDFPQYPDKNFYAYYNFLKWIELNKDSVKEKMTKYIERCFDCYFYFDDEYVIVIPGTLNELIDEALHQHNCLLDYVEDTLDGLTNIVFLRKRKNNDIPLVTIEICEDCIIQAKRRFNKELLQEEREFIKKFANEKHLSIDM